LTKIYLIRHAESEGNIYRRAHGRFNGQITAMGHKQIEQLSHRFKDEKIDAIYSSDLDRAVTTATALSEPRNLPINKSEFLREVDLGEWEDVAWGDLEYIYPKMQKLFNSDPASWHVMGSESLESVESRMIKILKEIGQKHKGETIAVFSHGFAIRSLICKLLGVPSNETHKVMYCDNSGVALLNYNKGKLTVEYHGDNSHLCDETSTLARQTWWREDDDKIKENLRYESVDSCPDNPDTNPTIRLIVQKINFDLGFIAFLDNEPVGLLALDKSDANIGKIIYTYVKPEYKDRNFFEQLIGQAIAVFRKLNKKIVQIIISSGDKDKIAFFQKFGFKIINDDDEELGILEFEIK